MTELFLYGSTTKKMIPVMNPARYANAPATLVAIGCVFAAASAGIAAAAAPTDVSAECADAPHAGQNAFPFDNSFPHDLQKLIFPSFSLAIQTTIRNPHGQRSKFTSTRSPLDVSEEPFPATITVWCEQSRRSEDGDFKEHPHNAAASFCTKGSTAVVPQGQFM